MSVLDYVDIGSYIYKRISDEKEEKWIIKDIKCKDLLIQNKDSGKTYKMTDKELEILYRKRQIRLSRKGDKE